MTSSERKVVKMYWTSWKRMRRAIPARKNEKFIDYADRVSKIIALWKKQFSSAKAEDLL